MKGLVIILLLAFGAICLVSCKPIPPPAPKLGDCKCVGTDLFYFDGRGWQIIEESSVYCAGENPETRTHYVIGGGGHCV